MIRRLTRPCLIALLILAPARADSPAIADAQLAAQLSAIDSAAARVKDFSARFEQRKVTALLKKPLVSSGTVRCAGAAIRWDTEQPEPVVLYADGVELRLYYPRDKLEEIYSIDQRLGDLISSPVPRLPVMERHFKIEPAVPADLSGLFAQGAAALRKSRDPTVALRMTPVDPALTQHVRQVIVVLDAQTALALVVQTIDADGDRTEITFSDVKVNTGIEPAKIELQIPPNTSISHPMEGAPATAPSP